MYAEPLLWLQLYGDPGAAWSRRLSEFASPALPLSVPPSPRPLPYSMAMRGQCSRATQQVPAALFPIPHSPVTLFTVPQSPSRSVPRDPAAFCPRRPGTLGIAVVGAVAALRRDAAAPLRPAGEESLGGDGPAEAEPAQKGVQPRSLRPR
jgi:hypothetical protein